MAFNGKRAKQRREELDLSHFDLVVKMQEIAAKSTTDKPLKLRPEYISKYEHGKRQPGRRIFALFQQVLSLPVEELEV